ncbi:hypothetical protein ElyMa_003607500 [Elysia marginata]|uniref:Transmembrane protein n=1 Tax=Elysia marginata TaxID=1093978 RepID=A0AAV4EQW3_9GAST|nr:hypothetical protein ElyMa_003607500 [Elysia marginata]
MAIRDAHHTAKMSNATMTAATLPDGGHRNCWPTFLNGDAFSGRGCDDARKVVAVVVVVFVVIVVVIVVVVVVVFVVIVVVVVVVVVIVVGL